MQSQEDHGPRNYLWIRYLDQHFGGRVDVGEFWQKNITAVMTLRYISRFNRTLRYDWLVPYLFESRNELQAFATNWLWLYNHGRPNIN